MNSENDTNMKTTEFLNFMFIAFVFFGFFFLFIFLYIFLSFFTHKQG